MKIRKLVAYAVLTATAAFSAIALAAPVDNPGPFSLVAIGTSSRPVINFYSGDLLNHDAGFQLDLEVDSAGNVTFDSVTTSNPQPIGSVTVGGEQLKGFVQVSGLTGTLNAATGASSLAIVARVKFSTATSTILGSSCWTPYFTATLANGKNWRGTTQSGYHSGTGELDVGAQDFTIASITQSCNSNAATINTALGLGNTGNASHGPGMGLYKTKADPILTGH